MDMIVKAMHTENNEFYCIVKDDEGIYYALLDDEYEDDVKLPHVALFMHKEEEEKAIGKYKHFKGKEYEVFGLCYDIKGEKYVYYKALYDAEVKYFIRPYDMFFSPVDKEKYPDIDQEFRFEKIE